MERTNRAKLIGIIHMQKAVAKLTDDEYRSIINSITGNSSCIGCNMQQLYSIHANLNSVLKLQGQNPFIFNINRKKKDIRNALESRAQKVLGENWHARLAGYLKKINRQSINGCTPSEIRQVMGWISTIEREVGNGK